MRELSWRAVGYALLLSLPAGLGPTLFAIDVAGPTPAVIGFGVALTAGLFAVVYLAATPGADAPDPPEDADQRENADSS